LGCRTWSNANERWRSKFQFWELKHRLLDGFFLKVTFATFATSALHGDAKHFPLQFAQNLG
jgi:hypothetical protein